MALWRLPHPRYAAIHAGTEAIESFCESAVISLANPRQPLGDARRRRPPIRWRRWALLRQPGTLASLGQQRSPPDRPSRRWVEAKLPTVKAPSITAPRSTSRSPQLILPSTRPVERRCRNPLISAFCERRPFDLGVDGGKTSFDRAVGSDKDGASRDIALDGPFDDDRVGCNEVSSEADARSDIRTVFVKTEVLD
jgi:hypothetical protein